MRDCHECRPIIPPLFRPALRGDDHHRRAGRARDHRRQGRDRRDRARLLHLGVHARSARPASAGSTISCCPKNNGGSDANAGERYGDTAMEVLINGLLKRGARRGNLEAKVFGGARVLSGATMLAIGDGNIAFVTEFLKRRGHSGRLQGCRRHALAAHPLPALDRPGLGPACPVDGARRRPRAGSRLSQPPQDAACGRRSGDLVMSVLTPPQPSSGQGPRRRRFRADAEADDADHQLRARASR